ncbi:MAG: S1C family serine protease [Lentisphaeria bacterium]|nr:S1C family serine protease [Lentisphaeria bacterium]
MHIFINIILCLTLSFCSLAVEKEFSQSVFASYSRKATVGVTCNVGRIMFYYGTGVIISPNGYILTSTTVTPKDANNIEILLTSGLKVPANIIQVDPASETALLKINMVGLPYVHISTELPRIGEPVYTLGVTGESVETHNDISYSKGVVSGIYPVKSVDSQSYYSDIGIETDAAVNPGQDGGPMLDETGRLIGIISLAFGEHRWQGTAVPMTKIIEGIPRILTLPVHVNAYFKSTPETDNLRQNQAFFDYYRNRMVKIYIARMYPKDHLPQKTLQELIKEINPTPLTIAERKQVAQQISAFHEADELISSNRILRRPSEPVSGIIISSDGYIATSYFNLEEDKVPVLKENPNKVYHVPYSTDINELTKTPYDKVDFVVNEIISIQVELSNGKRYDAELIGNNTPYGLSLLKIKTKGLPFIDLPINQPQYQVGTKIFLMGKNDSDLYDFTVNVGTISAVKKARGNFFQFDARHNYGNSGGVIFSDTGRFLGMAGKPLQGRVVYGEILSHSDLQGWQRAPNSGVGYALSAEKLRTFSAEVIDSGTITKRSGAFMGIVPDTHSLIDPLVRLEDIIPNSPAQDAGLVNDDLILYVDGKYYPSWSEMVKYFKTKGVGEKIILSILRPLGNTEIPPEDFIVRHWKAFYKQTKLKRDNIGWFKAYFEKLDIPITLGAR